MKRVIAIVVGCALLGAAGQLSRLHTHAYTAHDHPEHHHGIAAHEHPQAVPPRADEDGEAAHFEPCDPSQHAVLSFATGSAPASSSDNVAGQSGDAHSVQCLVVVRAVHTVTDIRVHGPPPLEQSSPRAPPLTLPRLNS